MQKGKLVFSISQSSRRIERKTARTEGTRRTLLGASTQHMSITKPQIDEASSANVGLVTHCAGRECCRGRCPCHCPCLVKVGAGLAAATFLLQPGPGLVLQNAKTGGTPPTQLPSYPAMQPLHCTSKLYQMTQVGCVEYFMTVFRN